MDQAPPEIKRSRPGWGVPASVAAHLLLLALLFFNLPTLPQEPETPPAIAIEIVPPAEQAEPEPPQEQAQEESQPQEDLQQEEPQQEEPQPEQAASDKTPPAEQPEGQEAASPIQVLRPVFAFGEEDTGPRETTEGNAAAEPQPEDAPEPTETAEEGIPLPADKPPLDLDEARTLFSRAMTDDPRAATAMAGLPRELRGSELCTSELREQLRNATPPLWPDLLPAYRLDSGNEIEVRGGAFRAGGQWFDLSFRCEVDGDAMRVVSFAFSVGAPIPRAEWTARGFPDV